MKARVHDRGRGRLGEALEAIDEVLTHPPRSPVPPDHLAAVLDVDGAGQAVGAKAIPIPELEGKYIRGSANLKHHVLL